MNILVVAFHQVYPLETGASVAQVGIIDYLSNQCNLNVSLLLPEENSALTDQELFEIGQILPKVKIYQLDNRYTPKNKLVKRLVNFARVYKHKIKLILTKDPRSNQQEPSPDEEFIGMYSFWDPFYIHHEKYVEILKQIIWQDKIDIVQLEYVENLNLVTVLPAHVKTVFVEHECIFYRIQSHIKAKQIKSVIAEYVFQFYRTVEAALLEKVDGVVTFNKFENLLLNDALKNKNHQVKFLVSPFPVLERDFRKINREEFSRPSKLIFVGGEHHFPNKDAVEWFIEKIAVEVFNKFGLRLFVVGKWKPDTIKKYRLHLSGVQFAGFIDDLYEFSKDGISIAPVRIGGGLKTKILLAMAQGIPVISTTFALEGIEAQHLESVMVADDKDSFCWAVEYLIADVDRTFAICQNAQNLIKQGYSQSVAGEIRYSFYQSLYS